jgi:hypothetical protein
VLFTANLAIGQDQQAPVVLASLINIDGNEQLLGMKPILGNAKVIPFLATYGDRIQIQSSVNAPVAGQAPYIFPVAASDSAGGVVECTTLYNFFTQSPNETRFELLAERLKAQYSGFTEAIIKEIKTSFDLIQSYYRGEGLFKILVPEIYFNNDRTLAAVKDHNKRLGHQFEHISSEINKTHFMETETDTFFVELPEYDRLKSADIGIQALIPEGKDIASPYPHPIYRTPYALRFSDKGGAALREIMNEVASIVKITDAQRTDVPKIDPRRVVGTVSNNDLDIQDNEMDFRRALEEYIRYDISQYRPEEDVNENYRNQVCSPRMHSFLDGLLDEVVRLNWSHTNKFPIAFDSDEDDEDSDDRDYEAENKKFYDMGEGIDDGTPILQTFLDNAAKSGMGFTAYIEAIIKLARWGSVKPNVLKLGDYKQYLDLNTFMIRNTTGNLANMKPELVDGYELVPISYILFDDKFKDLDYRKRVGIEVSKINIPLGLLCERVFSGGQTQFVYVSVFDLVSRFKKDPNAKYIKGIHYNDGVFTVDPELTSLRESIPLRVVNDNINSDIDRMHVHETGHGIKELTLVSGGRDIYNLVALSETLYSANSLSRWYDGVKVSSKKELDQKIGETPLPPRSIIHINLANVIVPVVLEAASRYDEVYEGVFDTAQILNTYMSAMRTIGFNTEGQFLEEIGSAYATPTAMANTVNRLAGMQAFGAQSGTPQATQTASGSTAPESAAVGNPEQLIKQDPSVKLMRAGVPQMDEYVSQAMRDFLIVPHSADENIIPISHNEKIVGGFVIRTVNDKPIYILVDDRYIPAGATPTQNTLETIMVQVLDCFYRVIVGTPHSARVRFTDVETLVHYRDILSKKKK